MNLGLDDKVRHTIPTIHYGLMLMRWMNHGVDECVHLPLLSFHGSAHPGQIHLLGRHAPLPPATTGIVGAHIATQPSDTLACYRNIMSPSMYGLGESYLWIAVRRVLKSLQGHLEPPLKVQGL